MLKHSLVRVQKYLQRLL